MADNTFQASNAIPEQDSPASNVLSAQDHAPASASGSTAASSTSLLGPGGQALPQVPGAVTQPSGATVYSPTEVPSTELNPRSCVTCRRRKVRCDKLMPCTNCRRALIPCVFPAPERAPRRPRRKEPKSLRPHQSSEREIELLKRLRKLEGIVEDLSGQVELEATRQHSSSGSPDTTAGGHGGSGDAASSRGSGSQRAFSIAGNLQAGGSPGRLVGGNNSSYGALVSETKETQKQLGNLVINDYGRSRYVSSGFWSKINDELDELRAETQRINEDSDNSDTESTPPIENEDKPASASAYTSHHAFVFGYQSASVDLRSLHPLPSLIPYIWQVYQENVDPVVKILHIPTTSKLIRDVRANLNNISPAAEALMFAIYYAAVCSLEESEVQTNFLAEKELLVTKYRFALEQALAKAEFMTSSEIVTMQAFVLYLVLVRRHDDTRLAWTLTGLAARISHSLGLHRDGSHFPTLKPFEVEMRRRLFWSLCILDMRSAEDLGTDLILDRNFDTRLPLNINDAEISPESVELPVAREGATDMTFSLIRFEICQAARLIHSYHGDDNTSSLEQSLPDRERVILDVYNRVENVYLKGVDSGANPMFWVAANIARVICAKLTLVIYQPVLFPAPGNEALPTDLRDRLFAGATELFEYTNILTGDPRTKQWRWLFQSYTQWHAVAYTLMEVARRPWNSSVERAWDALTKLISNIKSHDLQGMVSNAAVWVPFRMLYNKARKHRESELQRLNGNLEEVVALDRDDRGTAAPTLFSSYRGSEANKDWRNKWLQLVGFPSLPEHTPTPGEQETLLASVSVRSPEQRAPPYGRSSSTQQPNKQQQQSRQQSEGGQPSQNQCPAMDEENTALLNHVFTKPVFQPSDLWPMAFPDAAAVDNGSVFGTFGSADMPRQDPTLAAFATKADRGHSDIASGATQPADGSAAATAAAGGASFSDTPLVDEVVKDNPPPWLWKDSADPSSDYSNVLSFAAMSGEMDINMDEDFNWQDFGQTLGEMQTGIWGSHGL